MNAKSWLQRSAVRTGILVLGSLLVFEVALRPSEASAQLVSGGDFDVCDYCGTLTGNTARLRGRAGFGTDRGIFILINAANDAQDVDRDGYTPGVDFTDLYVSDTTDFRNAANPDQAITRENFVLAGFLNPLRNGFQNSVSFFVNIPVGTPAGIYTGTFTIQDSVAGIGQNPNGEVLRRDFVLVEIEVLPERGVGLVEGDEAARLDSLVLRGRPGQTVSGVVRIANIGNVDLSNLRLEATDLVATSGTGLRVRREQITFSPADVRSIAQGDTVRVTVTARIPLGILAGTYRGDLILGGEGVPQQRVPLILIVTTPGDIVFETNPVIGRSGDNAVIIFNADAGTTWQLRIFDMMAITTFAAEGTVFAGTPPAGTDPGFPGDEAVRYTWPLVNGRGENVAGGMYLVIADVVQGGDRRQIRGKLMVIR